MLKVKTITITMIKKTIIMIIIIITMITIITIITVIIIITIIINIKIKKNISLIIKNEKFVIKLGKMLRTMYCLWCKDYTYNFRPQEVKMINKVLREKFNCIVC